MINYISTRDKSAKNNFIDVLMQGLAPDGGLFIPEEFPQFDHEELQRLRGAPYADIAYYVIKPFIGDAIDDEDLKRILGEVYDEPFAHSSVAPLVQIGPNSWILELFHGPTLAFKDYALQLLGRLFDHVLAEKGERITIVGATSGDTGSAAIEACKGCENIDIFILHPHGRTSEVQRRQMTTIDAPNVHNIALEGTFDDCQNIVKAMFNDKEFRADVNLSAVNSINWARIMAQIVYYVTSSLALGGPERSVSFAVPTGNFGNIYAAYAAQKMGLPIKRLAIGSNRNDILTRFFESGAMSASGVEPSLSPSMDIQISSNFERYLCDLLEHETDSISKLMDSFKSQNKYSISEAHMAKARSQFSATRCDDAQTIEMMRECYANTGYILDPHTAVGVFAANQLTDDPSVPLISLACAHPAKFPDAVKEAIGVHPELPKHLEDLYDRPEFVSVLKNDQDLVQDFVRKNIK
jgi:threonine synthase